MPQHTRHIVVYLGTESKKFLCIREVARTWGKICFNLNLDKVDRNGSLCYSKKVNGCL